jgi:hypothetical protein
MGLFSWVPTINEVLEFIECHVMDHDWKYFYEYRECQVCGKKESTE